MFAQKSGSNRPETKKRNKKTREIKFHDDTPLHSEKFSLSHATLIGFKKHHIQKLNVKINLGA